MRPGAPVRVFGGPVDGERVRIPSEIQEGFVVVLENAPQTEQYTLTMPVGRMPVFVPTHRLSAFERTGIVASPKL